MPTSSRGAGNGPPRLDVHVHIDPDPAYARAAALWRFCLDQTDAWLSTWGLVWCEKAPGHRDDHQRTMPGSTVLTWTNYARSDFRPIDEHLFAPETGDVSLHPEWRWQVWCPQGDQDGGHARRDLDHESAGRLSQEHFDAFGHHLCILKEDSPSEEPGGPESAMVLSANQWEVLAVICAEWRQYRGGGH